MLKLIGAVLFISSCTVFGIQKGMDVKTRSKELVLLKRVIVLLKEEIKYARTPLPEAFLEISRSQNHFFGDFLQMLVETIQKQPKIPIRILWENAVDRKLGDTKLTKEDKEQLKKIGECLGCLDVNQQQRTFELYLERLELSIRSLDAQVQEKMRIYTCLGIFCGILVTLVLL